MRLLIVGEAPGRRAGRVLSGRCGVRLAAFCALSPAEFRQTFALENLLPTWPGQARLGKGAAWPGRQARQAASVRHSTIRAGRIVLLLGLRVAQAFRVRQEYFVRQCRSGVVYVVVPHPSGVNRWFNDPWNAAATARFMWHAARGRMLYR